MSEKLHATHEHHHSKEHVDIEVEVKRNLERIESEAENNAEAAPEHTTEQLRSTAEKEAVSGKEYSQDNSESAQQHHSFAAHAQLKADAYKKLLQNTQKHLTKPERVLSSFLHRPSVEKVSEIAAKTIARPVGVTYGALFAAVGVSVALFFAYRYGFAFNYLLFMFLFVGGYIVATIGELIVKLFRKNNV